MMTYGRFWTNFTRNLLIFNFVSNLQEEVENDDVGGEKGGASDTHELTSADEPEPVLKTMKIT